MEIESATFGRRKEESIFKKALFSSISCMKKEVFAKMDEARNLFFLLLFSREIKFRIQLKTNMYWWFPQFENSCPFVYYYQPNTGSVPQVKMEGQESMQEAVQAHEEDEESVIQNEVKEKIIDQLRKFRKKLKEKKIWSFQEDNLLIDLVDEGKTFEEVSEKLRASVLVCQTRYARLKKQRAKWPKEVDEDIINLKSRLECWSWGAIREEICSKFQKNYTLKAVKDRYQNVLRQGLSNDPWSIEDDIKFLTLLKKHKKKWALIERELPQRSQRQMKNRYKTILAPILLKIRKLSLFQGKNRK